MEQAVPEHILNAFPFKFSSRKSRVSWAYILPKFKKDWKAGRPIVSFSAHPARQFLVIMAKVTEMLVAEVCPHARPYNDAILLWQAIHQLFGRTDLQSPPAPDPLILHNQDLSGFFVSIPVERFMITFRLLLAKFYGCADEDLENTLHHATITVDLANDLSVMKTIRGRHCLVHDKHVAVPMRLFLDAVRVSFKFTLFTVGGQTIQQLRGAPMGSHFSPAACHAVVSLYEHMYFGHCLLQSARMPTFGLVVRYVDNRLALLHQSCDQQSVVRAFLHPDVYIPPIILEYEEGNIFLGFDIDPVARTVSYVPPDASWKFLHRRSAANTRTLLSMNAASIQIHNEEMANRMLERIHDSLPGRSRGRSRSPPVHPGSPLPRRRQAIADEPDSSAELAVLQAGQRTFDYPEGPMLPEPSRDWIKVTTEDYTELWVRFHPVPPHQKGRFDHQHAVWAQFYCTRIVASMELYGFDPTDDTKEKKPQWKLFEKLLLHYRAPVIQDYSRIRAAVELTSDQCPVLNAGPRKKDGSPHYWPGRMPMLDMLGQTKLKHYAWVMLKPFVREDMMDGRGAYWLFPAGTDQFQGFNDSGGYEAPVGIFLILGTTLPDDPNTCYSVPFVHNTVCQDLSSIIDQRVIRPSYYDRGDKTWPPSLGFYGRMVHPTSAIRQPVLDGSQPDHLYAMTSSMHTARRYGGKESDTRTVAAIGWTLVRQHKHAKVAHSSDPVFGHMFDLVHGTDGRWLFRSSRSILTGAATFWSNWQA
ncbi:hypothetical protein AK812_SmicGene42383 [Symbiodinium microadriaticum]|uniref:Reverse transcriptase domain-containing protein n=1 Tax=Symbiodinium microadriaticum TaxID=2951 RepID=A0A1Q9C3Q1_SYMMI|nr:hypothetical protein AK812_SmicGene42383 [Symbiodinium microadriaticum]